MKKTFQPTAPEKVELTGFLAEFREALEQEREAIDKNGQSATLLTSGRQLEQHGSEFWYRFNVDYAPSMPADTPCKLIVGKDQYEVTVVSFEENAIILASKNPLPPTMGSVRLENGSTVLIERLIRCIEEESKKSNPIGRRMLLQEDGTIYRAKAASHAPVPRTAILSDKQYRAVQSALQNDITYIWGPPGTGKTSVIGDIIEQLYKQNRSVLVVSHTNTAVDGAINKAVKTYKEQPSNKSPFPILRLGISDNVKDNRASLDAHVQELGRDLSDRKAAVEKRQSSIHQQINGMNALLLKNEWVKNSQIDALHRQYTSLLGLASKEKDLRKEIVDLEDALKFKKALTPEYEKYLEVSKTFDRAEKERRKTEKRRAALEEKVTRLPTRLMHADDELKKHSLYAELKAQEARLMSEKFLRGEIERAKGNIASLKEHITKEASAIAACEAVISKYQTKSSFAKLFANKNSFEQARREKANSEGALARYNSGLKSQLRLLDEYEQQLEDLQLLQLRIKAVEPAKTKTFWEVEKQLTQKELAESRIELAELDSQIVSMTKEVDDLEKKKNILYPAYEKIAKLEQDKKAAESRLQQLSADKISNEQSFKSLLEHELTLCEAFLDKNADTSQSELFEALSQAYQQAQADLKGCDIQALQDAKKLLSDELIELQKELAAVKEKMNLLEKQAVMNAKIVGATLTKAYLSDLLRGRTFDTVILDEASMASIPALWCASYLAEKNLVIVGDFLQLPPIVISDEPMAQKWLGRDIFYHSGMQKAAREKSAPKNFVMLNEQFRTEKDIADIANMYYGEYAPLITPAPSADRQKKADEFYSWYTGKRTKSHIHLIDTESLHAWVTGIPQGGKSHSRLNSFSAAVDVDLAFQFLEKKLGTLKPDAEPAKEPSILIVAPYKPHVKRIQQLIEIEYQNRGFKENLNLISAGTIHSFQGNEADIVIFDLVIDEPHWRANLFMTDPDVNADLKKMFNVAVTRAKFKLFIVGNFAYCQKRAKENALADLLNKLLVRDGLPKEDAKELLPNITFYRKSTVYQGELPAKHIVCHDVDFDEYFMKDLSAFRKRVIIYSPFMTENRISRLLPVFVDAIQQQKQIIVITKAHSDRKKTELSQYLNCESELKRIGVTVFHKQGMHEKTILFDDKVVWNGSLNALSFTGLTGEIMHRFEDRSLTAVFEKDLDIEHLSLAVENKDEQACPICGGEMTLKEGSEGGFFWQCVNADYSRKADQQYPRDGILRCRCGAPFVFSMKTEPRWICSEDPKHPQQKMRENDLRLEKMAALIPKSRRKEVERFFASKKKGRESASKPKALGQTKAIPQSKNKVEKKDDESQLKLF